MTEDVVAQEFRLSDFQTRVLEQREDVDLFVGGGRGGGKSWTEGLLSLRHVEEFGSRANVLYLRKTYPGVRDFENVTRELFGMAYGTEARYNAGDHVWRFPNGGYMEIAQLEDFADYNKFQGRSFTLLLIDEAGQYATPDLLDLLRSNLRGPRGMPIRVVIAANPGGPGHYWLARRYVFQAAPWTPFIEEKSGRPFIYCPSTYLENPHIDQAQYHDQLASACSTDPELLKAWLTGDWAIARGAYFAGVLEESRNAIDPLTEVPRDRWGERWETWLAHDFGSTAPSVTYLLARSPGAMLGDRFIPRDSIVAIDELAACRRDSLEKGLGWTAAVTAENIREFCKRWNVAPSGVADDACFARTGSSAGSIAEEFARGGVTFQPARKSERIPGWQLLKRLMADAGKVDQPGLYISRACSYFWQTVPTLPRDQKRVEDVDSSGPDHAADAMRYGVLRQSWAMDLECLKPKWVG